MKSFNRRTLHGEFDEKREKCGARISLSSSPYSRYRSEKNFKAESRDVPEGIPDAMRCRSTVKIEPVSMDNDNEICVKNEEIKIKEQEIQSLSVEKEAKEEELRLVREEVKSREEEALLKDNRIQSQCEEISQLKSELKKQAEEVNTLRADVELLKETDEEKEKYLSNMKITQVRSTEKLARFEGIVKSLEAQTIAHQENVNRVTVEKVALEENVNQLTVEKELVEMKSCKLQRLNENLRGQLEKEKEREIDLDKLRSFLDSGRAEIAKMREELARMKIYGFAKCPGTAANTDVELLKMKEDLNNLKVEKEKFKTFWTMVKNENATLRKDQEELQQVEHSLRREVASLKTELDNVRKENNNNVRGQNNNNVPRINDNKNNNRREQVPASGWTGWSPNQRPHSAQALPTMMAAAPQSGHTMLQHK